MMNKRFRLGILLVAVALVAVGGLYRFFEPLEKPQNRLGNRGPDDLAQSQAAPLKHPEVPGGSGLVAVKSSATGIKKGRRFNSANNRVSPQLSARSANKKGHRGSKRSHRLSSSVDEAYPTQQEKMHYYREMIDKLQGAEGLSIQPLGKSGAQALRGDIMTTLSKDPQLFSDFAEDLRESLLNTPGAVDQTEDYRAVFDAAQQAMEAPVSIDGLQCGPVLCVARLSAENEALLNSYRQQLLQSGSHLVWQVFGGANAVDPETGRAIYQLMWSSNPNVMGFHVGQPAAPASPAGG